jgi:hypothetical protein
MAYGTGPEPERESKRTNDLARSRAICHKLYALLLNGIRFPSDELCLDSQGG